MVEEGKGGCEKISKQTSIWLAECVKHITMLIGLKEGVILQHVTQGLGREGSPASQKS